jgi:hypothetical protein
VLQLKFSADKPVAHVAVRLNQVWPDGAVSRLSYAVFNLCHRDGHEHPQPLEPGKPTPCDRARRRGLQGPQGPQAARVDLHHLLADDLAHARTGDTDRAHRRQFHRRAGSPAAARRKPPVFAPAEAAPPVKLVELDKPFNKREVTIDQRTGETRLTIVDDFGRSVIAEHGMTTWACGREHYSIHPDDPLSARNRNATGAKNAPAATGRCAPKPGPP